MAGNRGIVTDVKVGESLALTPTVDGTKIVVTVEFKSGQRVRLRVHSEKPVGVARAVAEAVTDNL